MLKYLISSFIIILFNVSVWSQQFGAKDDLKIYVYIGNNLLSDGDVSLLDSLGNKLSMVEDSSSYYLLSMDTISDYFSRNGDKVTLQISNWKKLYTFDCTLEQLKKCNEIQIKIFKSIRKRNRRYEMRVCNTYGVAGFWR